MPMIVTCACRALLLLASVVTLPGAVALATVQTTGLKHGAGIFALKRTSVKPADEWQNLAEMSKQLGRRLEMGDESTMMSFVEQQKEYTKALAVQHMKNEEILRQNNDIENNITAYQTANRQLRAEAVELKRSGDNIRGDMQAIGGNMSVASDFLDGVIEREQQTGDEPELAVLRQFAEVAKSREHADSVNVIGSMLQTGANITSSQEILQSLLRSLDNLAVEENTSRALLRQKFAADYKVGADRTRALLEDQSRLNTNLEKEVQRNQRLTSAVVHLRRVVAQMLHQSSDIRKFAVALGENKRGGRPRATVWNHRNRTDLRHQA